MRRCIELGWTFLWISSVALGGGMAMVPLMEREFVDRRQWLTSDEILDMVAVTQSLPGLIAINMAVLIGYRVRGIAGAVVATLGSVITPFVVVAAIASAMSAFAESPTLAHIFLGIRAGTAALILMSLVKLARAALNDLLSWTLAAFGFVGATVFGIDIAFLILFGFAVGVGLIVVNALKRVRQ